MSAGIRLLILSDNKPGHVTGSMGILKSLEKLTPVTSVILQVHLRLKFMRYLLRVLLNSPHWIERIPKKVHLHLMRFFYKIDNPLCLETGDPFDWLVSAGGDTSFLNAWIARLYSIKNIYCSSLRNLNPSLFTIRITLGAGEAGANEIKMELSPAPVDREKINEQGRQFRSEQNLEKNTVWAVLIGGDGAGYHYDCSAMELLAGGLLALAERHKACLLITTSRRTGMKLEQTLKSSFDNHPAVAYATYFNHQPEKVVAKFLGAADVVFCTADSGSMITEAMAAGKPVYVLKPERIKPQLFYQAFLQQHIDARHIRQVSLDSLHTLDVDQDSAAYFNLLADDPISELTEKIKSWIRPETSCE